MKFPLLPVVAGTLLVLISSGFAQVPQLLNFQGRIAVGNTNFNGTGTFKFALVSGTGSITYWSNDGTGVNGSEPVNGVSLTVSNGIYSVLLGNATLSHMTVIPNSVFNNSDVRLRVWFNDGVTGSQLLSPDQRIAAVGYAIMSGSVVDNAVTTAKIADGAVTNAKLDSTLSLDLARKNSNQTFTGSNAFTNQTNAFTGSGNGLTGLNASNVASGVLADGRLSSNVVLASTNQTLSGAKTLNNAANVFAGNGSALTSLNAGNLTTGTVADARLSANVGLRGAANLFSGANTFSNLGNSFTGNGSGLTQLNASALSSGTLLDARLSANVPRLAGGNNFTGGQTITSGFFGVGTTTPGERIEVNAPDATVRIRNSNDAIGGWIGDSWGALQLGIYNPGATSVGVVPASTKRSFFGIDGVTGKVGSLTNNFLEPAFRVVLDDGSGNMQFGNTRRQMLNLFDDDYGIGVQDNTLYQRSTNGFAWFKGGMHTHEANNPGPGGTRLMSLSPGGNLDFNNMPGIHFSQGVDRQSAPYFRVQEGDEATVDEVSIRCPAAGYVLVFGMIDASGDPGHASLYDVTSGQTMLASQPCNNGQRGAHFSWVITVSESKYVNLRTTVQCVDDLNPVTIFLTTVHEHSLSAVYFPVRHQ